MKKISVCVMLLLFLGACGISQEDMKKDSLQDVTAKYQDGQFTTETIITENLGEQIQTYRIAFERTADKQDHLTILQPETIAGIELTVEKDQSPVITYEDTVLQTGLSELTGVTPADAVSVLLQDLGNRLPTECWTEKSEEGQWLAETIIDEQENQKIRKDIFIDPETGSLHHADIYVDDTCVLQLDFENFTWNT